MYQKKTIVIGRNCKSKNRIPIEYDIPIEICTEYKFRDFVKIKKIYGKIEEELNKNGTKIYEDTCLSFRRGDTILYHYRDATIKILTGYDWNTDELDRISLSIITQNLDGLVSDLMEFINKVTAEQ